MASPRTWKWVALGLGSAWIATLVALAVVLFSVVDQGVTLHYQAVGYADCAAHRDYLDAQARGRLSREMMRSRSPEIEWSTPEYTRSLQADEVVVQYDAQGRYRASQIGASTTTAFRE